MTFSLVSFLRLVGFGVVLSVYLFFTFYGLVMAHGFPDEKDCMIEYIKPVSPSGYFYSLYGEEGTHIDKILYKDEGILKLEKPVSGCLLPDVPNTLYCSVSYFNYHVLGLYE